MFYPVSSVHEVQVFQHRQFCYHTRPYIHLSLFFFCGVDALLVTGKQDKLFCFPFPNKTCSLPVGHELFVNSLLVEHCKFSWLILQLAWSDYLPSVTPLFIYWWVQVTARGCFSTRPSNVCQENVSIVDRPRRISELFLLTDLHPGCASLTVDCQTSAHHAATSIHPHCRLLSLNHPVVAYFLRGPIIQP